VVSSLRLSHQNSVRIHFLPHARYMQYPPHSPRFAHSNYISLRVQVMKLIIMNFSPASYYYTLLRSKYLPQHPLYLPLKFLFSKLLIPKQSELNYGQMMTEKLYVWIFLLEASVVYRVAGGTPALYSRGLGFKSRPGGFFVSFKSSAK
jgi:hypothetical protein